MPLDVIDHEPQSIAQSAQRLDNLPRDFDRDISS
jgi:hypothetical protein